MNLDLSGIGWVHAVACLCARIGGGVNEMFLRVAVLRAMTPDVLHSPLVGTTHFVVMILFAILIAHFNVRYWNRAPMPEAVR